MGIIELNNVTYFYNAGAPDEVKAVDNVSLSIPEGEFVALVGHNGSGKSTVARLLNGLLFPQSGDVKVYDKLTTDKKALYEIRSQLGVVFQNPDNQMVATIIEDDVAFGPENLGLKSEEIRARVDWALESVGMADHKQGTPFRLSGGQKQRIAIAGVLALKPKVMVLDEATSMLDPIGRGEVLKVIKDLNEKEKMTVIMITHFMEEVSLADRVIVMRDGAVILDGTPREVFMKEEELIEAGLELPIPTKIAKNLREKGLPLKKGIIGVLELKEALAEIKTGAKAVVRNAD